MGEKTGISWTDHTFNPWIGCTKISDGCKFCYAERDNKRYSWVSEWGPMGDRKRTSIANWKKPLEWNAKAKADGVVRRVFCASLADIADDHPSIQDKWLDDLFELIRSCSNLNWLLLTKRPENLKDILPNDWNDGYKNVWLGTTCENYKTTWRLEALAEIPAIVKFVSYEPAIGDVFGAPTTYSNVIDWWIVGGESGYSARPIDLDWVRSVRNQCQENNIAFFFKQIGGGKRIDGVWGGNLLDGSMYHEFPK